MRQLAKWRIMHLLRVQQTHLTTKYLTRRKSRVVECRRKDWKKMQPAVAVSVANQLCKNNSKRKNNDKNKCACVPRVGLNPLRRLKRTYIAAFNQSLLYSILIKYIPSHPTHRIINLICHFTLATIKHPTILLYSLEICGMEWSTLHNSNLYNIYRTFVLTE